jgi:hypothetical protein
MPGTARIRCGRIVGALVLAAACGEPSKPPVASRLEFSAQPSNATAGVAITPQVRVRVLDASGNAFTGPMTVTLALASPNGATLSGTTSVAATNGIATFSDLRIEKAGTGYVLDASAGSLPAATSNGFDVSAGAATKLRFVGQPGPGTAGKPISPAVTVEIADQYDNRVTSATSSVTIAMNSGDSGGYLTGTATADAVSGLTTFDRITMTAPGNYTLKASAAGLTAGQSASFALQAAQVSRFCPADVATGGSFDSFIGAIVSTLPSGTVAVCDGTHFLAGVVVTRPVTITSEHPHGATLSAVSGTIFTVWGTPGTYTFRDLNFVVDDGAVLAFGKLSGNPPTPGYDQILVENNRFTMTGQQARALWLAGSDLPNAKVTVRGNVFTGGTKGIDGYNTAAVDVVDNTFNEQAIPGRFVHSASIYLVGGPFVVRNNVFKGCPEYCISVQGGPAEISDNTLETSAMRGTFTGINVALATANVSRNIIRGDGTVADRTNPNSYAFRWSGILVQLAPASVNLEGNSISNAYAGIQSNNGPATGSNNAITLVYAGVDASGAGPTLHRNDITDFVTAVISRSGGPAGMLSCNYWGTATGPTLSPALMPLVTPFSTVAIANKPDVKCP